MPGFLNFVHVICGVLWTGIDLFMGFVIGPILRKVGLSVRREIIVRLVPRTLFLMPTLSIITARQSGTPAAASRRQKSSNSVAAGALRSPSRTAQRCSSVIRPSVVAEGAVVIGD